MLEQHGYTVLAASTPEEALEMSASHDGHIDLLLTDIVMPRMSGPELAMQLAAQRPDMRMLYMSGYAESGVVRHGLVEAGTDFIQKPFTAATLIGKVREVLQLGGGNA
jgi:CheY-like chemotaxis protein